MRGISDRTKLLVLVSVCNGSSNYTKPGGVWRLLSDCRLCNEDFPQWCLLAKDLWIRVHRRANVEVNVVALHAKQALKYYSTPPFRLLYPRERPGTHCIGGCVGPRAGLDGCEKSRPHRVSIPRPSSP